MPFTSGQGSGESWGKPDAQLSWQNTGDFSRTVPFSWAASNASQNQAYAERYVRAHIHTHTHMLPQIYHRRCQERYGAFICSFQLFSFFFFSLFYHFHVLERIIKLIYLRIRVFVHSGKIQSWKSRLLSNIKHFYLLSNLSFTVHRLSECRVRMASSSAWVSGAASIKEQQPTLELNITIMK